MFYIRVDANNIIATGHLMRCFSIAEEIRRLGEEVTFIMADDGMKDAVLKRKFGFIGLGTVWNQMDDEIPAIVSLIDKMQITSMLIDSYFVTSKYLNAIKNQVQIIYIDDLHEIRIPCSQLINYTMYYDKYNYEVEYPSTELLLGCKYAPLRGEFQNISIKKIKKEVKEVLILTGGTDQYSFALNFVKKIALKSQYKNIDFQIICGRFNKDYDKLKSITAKNILIYQNITDMKEFMQKADIVISAGGTTLFELCACGTPTICYTFADNQLENAQSLSEKDYTMYAGDLRKDFLFSNLERLFNNLLDDFSYRKDVAVKMQKLIDGNGAVRIAERIMGMIQ